MAYEEQTDKTPQELADHVWKHTEEIRTCMLNTLDGDVVRARPLSSHVDREAHAFYFLVDVDGGKNGQIERNPQVSLAYSDTGSNKYVTVYGTASLSNDRAKIRELWSGFNKAWWDSENDPDIRLLTVVPENAEIWDSPNKLVATALMLTAAVTGAKPSLGDHAKVRI